MRHFMTGWIVCLAAGLITPVHAADVPCKDDVYRQFDFWAGSWEVSTLTGEIAGHNAITVDAGGCVLIEQWQGSNGNRGQSYNYFDATTNQWHQIWISPGVVIDYRGGLVDGAMTLEGEIKYQATAQKERFLGRWTPLDEHTVRQELKQYNRETEEWEDWFVGIYRRVDKD